MTGLVVRDATTADAAACAAVYAPYVLGTAASFELDPPGAEELALRIAAALRTHAWLVAERDGTPVGYAYATAYKPRPAYRWTCEVSVYVDAAQQRGGVGRSLYLALLERLAARGFRTAVATMTLPNAASAGLHEALGFSPAGMLARVGWKHGHWHDVALLRRTLGPELGDAGPPAEPS
ncbi:MAG TPA: GNAT family N-acetyltransferase [Friedmanniella sp.]